MSRYSVKIDQDKEFIYGFDHALGYFYEIWDHSKGPEDDDCIIEDRCQLLERLTKGEMVELMQKYKANTKHIDNVALDLAF